MMIATPFLITRPAGKADNLLASLDERGIAYSYQPLITTQQVVLKAKDHALLEHAELLIFVSVSAVHALEQQIQPEQLSGHLFAVGSTTASVLQRWSGREVIVPHDQRSEGLLALPQLQQVKGRQIVVVRGNSGRELIKQQLIARGATVKYVQSYNRLPLPLDGAQLWQVWQQQQVRCIVATSNEILQQLFAIIPEGGVAWLQQRHWLLVSPRMQEQALALGINPQQISLAENANDQALLQQIIQLKKEIL
ncbi:MAG: uroporphyrinogen-III synthase [Rheinheimera sp.]|uniref:uroporphyrinogen-III synthase n=1 Tax=Arsukibacterium sp. UBA3155 TaxID=1946058 RepID=UPI000C8C80CB|nr:uroporphyrinogen-III synthase [Arsukibacterium sp. UBA3155]MAD76379.1 uroporphyrinogen-III synthase [Rheinheimera sp.]|tara:strand:+ start:16375 stop:17127 length:753 start_codon:yes stop_codon:yes gene_type:complete